MRVWIGVILLGVLLSCNQPEEPWQPTYADSVEVKDSLDAWRAFLKASSMIEKEPIPFSFPYERIVFSDTLHQKFFPVSLYRVIEDTTANDSLIFNEDTTCTVILFEGFKGKVRIECESLTPLLEGKPVPIYDSSFIYKDTTIEKVYHSESWQHAFFRYNPEDSAWVLEKISRVMEIVSPDVAYSPEIDWLLLSQNGSEDTLRKDGFIPIDSIIGPAKIEIAQYRTSIDSSGIFFIGEDSIHYDFSQKKDISFSSKGFHHLLFEMVLDSSLIYPDIEYRSILWAIPILVK